jgi:hypothetical protein
VGNGNCAFARRKTDVGLQRADHEEDGDLLNTPGDRQWDYGIDAPVVGDLEAENTQH